MNHKKLSFALISVSFLLLLSNCQVFSQTAGPQEGFEDLYSHWGDAVGRFQLTAGIKSNEYAVFSRFSEKSLDSLRGDFVRKIANKQVTNENVKEFENGLVKGINTLYERFQKIEQLYPSSVDEFRNYRAPMFSQICDSGCDNIDFETGNLSGWYAYYGYNATDTRDNFFNITNITGGLAGAVQLAANDTLTSNPNFSIPANEGIGPNPRPDYQVKITSGNLYDALIPTLPEVSPFGGHHSVMLGDSSEVNFGVAILSQTFKVSASNANFTYSYAVVLANPNHYHYDQPFLTIAVIDQNGDTIPYCGKYTVISRADIPGFNSFFDTDYYPAGGYDTFHVYYKDWTMVNVPLTKYIGQCVTIVFEAADCSQGGHFGYAYVDASCSPLEIQSTSPNFCGQDSITLTGPAGEGHYQWTGPGGGIRGSDTLRQANVDSAGTYMLVITPFTGATCNDTLSIKIGKKTGPPPHPGFKSDTGCVGLSTPFLNTSNPLGGADFYWDFYNNGTFEDSSTNASWNYNAPGVYTVKLQELYNGCGMDTIIKVVIDSISTSAFKADTVCFRDTTYFTNMSSGGVTYFWNFGDPPSGANNTSVKMNPVHSFSGPGTYTVSLIAKHPDWCNDTVKENVIVLPLPKASISGSDSVCYGTSVVLTASGGGTYKWSTGATTASIKVSTDSTRVYSVEVSNGICSADTAFKLYLLPIDTGNVTGNVNVCIGDTIVLDASGGGTYLWNTGATTSSISIPANSFNDTAYSVIIHDGKSCVALYKKINIDSLYGDVCCTDTIFSGDSVVLSGSGGSQYYWLPPTGLSCDTCPNPIASPTVTTVYTLVTISSQGCRKSSTVGIDVEIPCKDFFVPNVFTPTGDGVNDTYYIKVEFMTQYEISIYNRWGQEVFHSTDPESPWDGTVHGDKVPAGVYYYIIRATCVNGNYIHKDGFVQLIR